MQTDVNFVLKLRNPVTVLFALNHIEQYSFCINSCHQKLRGTFSQKRTKVTILKFHIPSNKMAYANSADSGSTFQQILYGKV